MKEKWKENEKMKRKNGEKRIGNFIRRFLRWKLKILRFIKNHFWRGRKIGPVVWHTWPPDWSSRFVRAASPLPSAWPDVLPSSGEYTPLLWKRWKILFRLGRLWQIPSQTFVEYDGFAHFHRGVLRQRRHQPVQHFKTTLDVTASFLLRGNVIDSLKKKIKREKKLNFPEEKTTNKKNLEKKTLEKLKQTWKNSKKTKFFLKIKKQIQKKTSKN